LFFGDVEGDNGEAISIGGYGKALLSYFTPLYVHCFSKQETDPTYLELAQFVSEMGDIMCPLAEFFCDKMISSDWHYGEDDYQRYVIETQNTSLTEDQFKNVITHIKQAWTDISVFKSAVLEVLAVHQRTELRETWWYDPLETPAAFQAVYDALIQLELHGARRARLTID